MVSLTTYIISTLLALRAAAAENTATTISIFMPRTDPEPLDASIISANAGSTSLYLACPTGKDPNDCYFPQGITMQHINNSIWAASMIIQYSRGRNLSVSFSCNVQGSTAGVCLISSTGAATNIQGVITTTLEPTEMDFLTATVTAGAEKLASATANSTASNESSKSGASSSGVTATSTSAASSASPSATKNAAQLGFGKNPVVGGIAFAVGVLAM
jgi:hypothetical protein